MTYGEYRDRLTELKIPDDAIFTATEINSDDKAKNLYISQIFPEGEDFGGILLFIV